MSRIRKLLLMMLSALLLGALTVLPVSADDDDDDPEEPDSLIAFASNRASMSDIWVLDPDNPSQARRLTFAPEVDAPVWSPDGSRLVYMRFRRSDNRMSLWVINVDGTGDTQILDWWPRGGGSLIAHFWYSGDPNGERVYYVKDPGGSCSFFWIYADLPPSQSEYPVLGAENKCQPDISPDQAELVFRNYGQSVDLEVANLSPDGTQVDFLSITRIVPASLGGELLLPSWSNDGALIAFSVGSSGVYTVAPDGTELQQITTAVAFAPTWSPDSNQIAVHATIGDNEIALIPADGDGPLINLANNNVSDINPDWSPELDEDLLEDIFGDDDDEDDDAEDEEDD